MLETLDIKNTHLCVFPSELRGALAEDGAAAAPAAAAAEAGPLLAVQRRGADAAHVHLRAARSLDGLRVVLHRPQRDHGLLGHRWVQPFFSKVLKERDARSRSSALIPSTEIFRFSLFFRF